ATTVSLNRSSNRSYAGGPPMAAIIRETLVLRRSRNELNVELRLGNRATASAAPPALVHPQPPVSGRRPDLPGRGCDVDYATPGTRTGAGRSLRFEAATRKTGWRGLGA